MDLERLSQDAYGEAGPVKINPWGQAMTQRRRRVAWVHLSPPLQKPQRWATRHTLQTAQSRQDNGLPNASLTVNVVSQSGFMFPASESCKKCGECGIETAVTGGIPSP
jgi:hypothetical protein